LSGLLTFYINDCGTVATIREILEEFSDTRHSSKEATELSVRQSRVAHDVSHRDRVNRIVAGNRENPRAICHNDVFALAGNSEASFL
jgi:hypothetical protein